MVLLLRFLLIHCVIAADIPALSQWVKPEIRTRAIEKREIRAHAELDPVGTDGLQAYHFYSLMLVRQTLLGVRANALNYAQFHTWIPFVKKSEWNPASHLLQLEGGIWNYILQSQIRLSEKADRWIPFEVVGGHFKGMTGEMIFEVLEPRKTLVFFHGSHRQKEWPPTWIMERGAEVALSLSGKKLRDRIEQAANP